MKHYHTKLLLALACLAATPILAQTSIGSVTCASSTLNGTYEVTLGGREVTPTGTVSKLFQSTGTAVFDGQSKVTLNLTANTINGSQSFGTPLVYSGTYSVQSNCEGAINITSGDSATFAVAVYSINTATGLGRSFYIAGSDATYAYNGSGNQPATTCPVSSLNGVYPFNATGNTLSGASVTAGLVIVGAMQLDGQGNVTAASWTAASNATTTSVTASGTYSLTPSCLGSMTLTDTANNKYALSLILNSTTNFVFVASTPQAMFTGSARRQIATGTATCSASSLNGIYEFTIGGRSLSSGGVTTKLFQGNGTANFDGQSNVTLTLATNTLNVSQPLGTPVVFSGTYTVKADCSGSINLTAGDTATFALEAYSIDATTQHSSAFQLVGTDSTFAYNGAGNAQPASCATSTLSGAWPLLGGGNLLSGTTVTGTANVAGLLQFDGQGNATASWTVASNAPANTVTATGTYTLSAACLGTATLADTAGNNYSFTFSLFGATSGVVALTAANPAIFFTGTASAESVNPGQSVVNAASNTANATPAGSIFTVYGSNVATQQVQASAIPLPTMVLTTSVTVNGERAPIFYADAHQINAQMPEDIQPGIATVIVTNGNSVSNAVAVTVPATGAPGIFVYGQNRAVVVNANSTINSTSAPAKPGDVLVGYFTGGGPVQGARITSGVPTPGMLFPLTGMTSATVGGTDAKVNYIGLTPGSIGLYQVNFVVPNVAAGDHPLAITIAGQASNRPLIAITK